ncbi:MAG TPA: DUF1552 domain-containing protein [Polyangiaceae bacterium]|nr:DUF1552 domain-containing protein [Polyangiaceae bacterium]
MKIDRISRRMFLQGVSGSLLALPFLPSLVARSAEAQSAAAPLRLITIKSYSAQNIRDFYPARAVPGYTLRGYGGDETGGANGKQDGTLALTQSLSANSGKHSNGSVYTGKQAPLRDFASPGISRILGPALNPYLDKLLLLRGLDFLPDTNHNDGGILGNFGGGAISDSAGSIREVPTIDQVLAYSPKFYSTAPPGGRSLHLSPGRQNTFSYTHAGKKGGPVTQVQADTDPRLVFDRIFANVSAPAAEGVNPNSLLVNRVIEDYRRLRSHPRMSAEDRARMEQHIALMAELEARLQSKPGAACQAPPRPAALGNVGVNVMSLRQSYAAMLDILAAAIRCDLTRLVTLDVYKAIGASAGEEQGFEHSCASCQGNPNPTDWHRAAHDWDQKPQREKVVSINEWIAKEVFAALLSRLDVPEGNDKTFLDNSLVLWGNELGMNHLNYSVPVVMAGSAGGRLATGRYIDYIDWNQPVRFSQHDGMVIEGVPYNRLLVTILQALGLSPEDYETEPNAGYGEITPLGKPATAFATDYDYTQIGQPLPTLLT